MAKRGAEDQISKDRDDSDSSSETDERVRTQPLAPVEGRPIRGIPKRKGLTPATSAAPSSVTPTFSFGLSSTSNPAAPSFNMGSSGNAPPSGAGLGVAPFSFGPSSAQSTTPASTPFSGFSFNKPTAPAAGSTPAPSSGFSFGSSSTVEAPKPTSSPFSGFSFGSKASAGGPPPANEPEATPRSNPFGSGFTFAGSTTNGTFPQSGAAQTNSSGSGAQPTTSLGFSAAASENAKSISGTEQVTHSTDGNADQSSQSSSAKPVANHIEENNSSKPESEPSPSLDSPPSEKEVAYYTELRGLNVSFLKFLTSSLATDPFLDLKGVLPGLLEQYKTNLDDAARKAGRPESRGQTAPKPNGVPLPVAPPAPPAVASFTLLKPAASNSQVSGGFTPSLPTSKGIASPFTFGNFGSNSSSSTTVPATQAETKVPSAEMNKLVEDLAEGRDEDSNQASKAIGNSNPFSSIPSSSNPDENPKPNSNSSLFSFSPAGPLHPTTPTSKTFVPSPNTTAPTPPQPSKLGKFGPGGSTPQLSFGGAKSTTPGTAPAFGSGSSFSFGFGGASSGSPAKAAPFNSGSTSTSTPASTGFSFGGKPAETSASAPAANPFRSSTAAKPTSTPFSGFSGFGAASTSTSTFATATAPSSADPDKQAAAEIGFTETQTPLTDLARTIGAGEEDEETIHECRAKLFKFEGGKQTAVGLGPFKIKKAKDGKRRFLMRIDGLGTLLMNMNLSTSLKATAEGKTIKFVGFTLDGKPMPYTLMVKTPELARELVSTIESEIESMSEK